MSKHSEIFEQPKEEVREAMEDALYTLMQSGDGYKCGEDAIMALEILRERQFFNLGDHIVRIDGPVTHYNHMFGRYVRDKHHIVGQINNEWIIDVSCQPGGRVFYSMNDYKERSGIKVPPIKK